jgi:hypothetical protein
MALKPGSHRLRIVSDLIKEQTVSFELAPGEQKEVTVNLQARHTYLNFDKAFDPRCSATVNGIQAGTLTELSYQYRVERPDLPHTVKLECGEESHDRNWEFMVGTATFTRP